jgi:hypothetical protein
MARSKLSEKVVTAGHTTMVEGLREFLGGLSKWPEIDRIHVRALKAGKSHGGGRGKQTQLDRSKKHGHAPVQQRRSVGHRSGFTFRATGWSRVRGSDIVDGIACQAVHGSVRQLIILQGSSLQAIKARLESAGYGAEW